MSNLKKLTRSVIFTPSDRESAMRKAISVLNADVVVFDLEDAVSPDQKENARKNVVNFLSAGHIKRCSVVVRVNCPKTTKWGQLDIAAISNCFVDALILPKVEEESTIKMASEILRQKSSSGAHPPLWCMIETPKGIQNVDFIANLQSVHALVFGSNDLTKELKARHTPTREPLLFSMSRCILAARGAGKLIIDGVHLDINDEKGLIDSCIQGRNLGFDGKSLIHPSQILATNTYFSPSESELLYAYKVVKDYEIALAAGKAVVVVENKLVEKLHVDQARQLIAEVEMILHLEKSRK